MIDLFPFVFNYLAPKVYVTLMMKYQENASTINSLESGKVLFCNWYQAVDMRRWYLRYGPTKKQSSKMEDKRNLIKNYILNNDDRKISDLLSKGLDPNYEGGWPIRLASRLGSYSIVKTFLHFRANPHLLGDSGASTLQLAVFSGKHWETDKWGFLLSCCDSSQLADGAAVAIVFHNTAAIKAILQTGRCNMNIPTTLTGKTVEQLAKGYRLENLLISAHTTPQSSPRVSRPNRTNVRNTLTPQPQHRNLSPSVARFFDQTAGQASLAAQRSPVLLTSPTQERV